MTEIDQALDEVIEQALEMMFFASVLEASNECPAGALSPDSLTASVTFSGSHSGALTVRASEPVAAALAGAFLGSEDGVAAEQAAPVLGEFANVVCGSLLGRVDPDGAFSILPPRVFGPEEGAGLVEGSEIRRSFAIEEGRLELGVTIA